MKMNKYTEIKENANTGEISIREPYKVIDWTSTKEMKEGW